MNRKTLALGILAIASLFSGIVLGQAPFPQNVYFFTLANPTNSFPASSTNTAKGTSIPITRSVDGVRITLGAMGINATTNAGSSTNGMTYFFETSPDGGATWDNARLSNIKLQMTSMDAATNFLNATNVVSDWFNLSGVTRIRQGRVENEFLGLVSNPVLIISYPFPQQVKPQ